MNTFFFFQPFSDFFTIYDLLVLKSTLVINEYFSIYFIFVESLASVTIIEEFYRNVIMKTCLFFREDEFPSLKTFLCCGLVCAGISAFVRTPIKLVMTRMSIDKSLYSGKAFRFF